MDNKTLVYYETTKGQIVFDDALGESFDNWREFDRNIKEIAKYIRRKIGSPPYPPSGNIRYIYVEHNGYEYRLSRYGQQISKRKLKK